VTGLMVLVAGLVLLGSALLWAVGMRNGLVRLRGLVTESWRQIDAELDRRHELIPPLVSAAAGHAPAERATLEAVVAARAAAMEPGAPVGRQALAEGALSSALGRLFAIAEAYPALRADPDFQALAAELTDTEDRVAAGRRFYNANVSELNARVESLPSAPFARLLRMRPADFFEVTDPAGAQAPVANGGTGPSR